MLRPFNRTTPRSGTSRPLTTRRMVDFPAPLVPRSATHSPLWISKFTSNSTCTGPYGPVQVLFDVNFEIHKGECVALLGTNGAGKSTILRVISGLEVPERGVVRLNGRNITYVAPENRARMGIVQLPGGKGTFPSLTIDQNLALSSRLAGGTRDEIDQRVEGVLVTFPELAERRKQPARSLSGGQQQMLALA